MGWVHIAAVLFAALCKAAKQALVEYFAQLRAPALSVENW